MKRLAFFRSPEEANLEEGHVLVTYHMETPLPLPRAAEALAAEQSTGTRLRFTLKQLKAALETWGIVEEF